MKVKRRVYLDNNATTRVDREVVDYMNQFYLNDYAVASSQFSHTPGIKAKDAVENARRIISEKINSSEDEIIFTSGEAESNNLAIKGIVKANKNLTRKKIIISKIEHFSVLNSAEVLKKRGYVIEKVGVDKEGFVDLEHLEYLVDAKTLLVSVMAANHEVGTVQDLKKISEIVHASGAYFHTDASYGFMQVPVDVAESNIDLLTITSHTIYGPKGVGALFVKRGTNLEKILDGGYQEMNLRPGLENVPGIAGFGKAVEVYSNEDLIKVEKLRSYLYNGISSKIGNVLLNGASDFKKRIPNNLNLTFEYIEGESVVLHLDMRGIAVITGSACFSRSLQASHILLAMGFSHERAHGSIRFSPGKDNSIEDMDYTIDHVKKVVEKLRYLSPLNKK